MGDMADGYDDEFNDQEPECIPYIRIIRETKLAWLLLLDETNIWNPEKVWFPKSRCTLDEDEKEILVPQWLAIEKGLV